MKLQVGFIGLLLAAGCAVAQDTRGYVFLGAAPNNGSSTGTTTFGILPPRTVEVAPTNNSYTVAAGLEARFSGARGVFGAGLDLAGIVPGTGKVFSGTIGTVSPNVYLHWPWDDFRSAPLDVYATGGYTAAFRDFTANGFNAGGGLVYWFRPTLGLAVEARVVKLFGTLPVSAASQYYQIRFGLSFR